MKLHFIREVIRKSENQSFISYLFPLFRYHSRWKDLETLDFKYYKINNYDAFGLFEAHTQYQEVRITEKKFKDPPQILPESIPIRNSIMIKLFKYVMKMTSNLFSWYFLELDHTKQK